MFKMLQNTTRKFLRQKGVYVNKFQLKEDSKISFIARQMKKKGLLVDTWVNSKGITVVRKTTEAGLTEVSSLNCLALLSDGRWEEFENL